MDYSTNDSQSLCQYWKYYHFSTWYLQCLCYLQITCYFLNKSQNHRAVQIAMWMLVVTMLMQACHSYFWYFTLHWTFFLNKNLLSQTFREWKWKEFCTLWKLIHGFYSNNYEWSLGYNHQHILLPMTQFKTGSTYVTSNMHIASVMHWCTCAVIFLADSGAQWFLLMFTFYLPFPEFLLEILKDYVNST